MGLLGLPGLEGELEWIGGLGWLGALVGVAVGLLE